MRILIVDDDSNIRRVLSTTLTLWDHEVREAADGNEALALMESHARFDLIILDWNMPGIKGIDVCRELASHKNPIYILILSGRVDDEDVAEGMEAGANDYLTKPFDPDSLRVRLRVAAGFIKMRSGLEAQVAQLQGGIVARAEVDELLSGMLNREPGVSDLLFVCGKQPQMEVYGKLKAARIPGWDGILAGERINQLAQFIMAGNERLLTDFQKNGSCDCSYAIEAFARFRVNIYKQNGAPAIVMRKLQSQIPSLDALQLPPILREVIKEKNGIIFVTGATGSGKTTTLAAMLNEINENEAIHVVTLEDPIEFLHPQKAATFSQRQLGQDFIDFPGGLRAALRQAPKVILVGEIRDRVTMEIAMTAAETGHLVFSTLHTVNAGQSIGRVVGMFDKEEEVQVRQRLAETLRYVISQRLVGKEGGGRALVTEIMGSSLRTREFIALGESESRNIQEIIEAGVTKGWHSFDQNLLGLYEQDQISEQTAMLYCNNKASMGQRLDKVKQTKGGTGEKGPVEFKLQLSPAAH